MNTQSTALRMVEVSGAEALWLLEGSTQGRLVHPQRDLPAVRPARHVREYGRLVVRTPAPVAAVPNSATYHVDEAGTKTGTGRTVTVTGPLDVIDDPHEMALLLRLSPQTVTGFRPAGGEA
jgi:hypothetical protein